MSESLQYVTVTTVCQELDDFSGCWDSLPGPSLVQRRGRDQVFNQLIIIIITIITVIIMIIMITVIIMIMIIIIIIE